MEEPQTLTNTGYLWALNNKSPNRVIPRLTPIYTIVLIVVLHWQEFENWSLYLNYIKKIRNNFRWNIGRLRLDFCLALKVTEDWGLFSAQRLVLFVLGIRFKVIIGHTAFIPVSFTDFNLKIKISTLLCNKISFHKNN